MNVDKHALGFSMDDETIDILRRRSLDAESTGQLYADQLKVIYNRRWFKMFVPPPYGGPGLTLPEVLNIEERLSWVDGSVGWVVTLCAGAGWFVGFVEPDVAREFFGKDDICIAGSGAVTGVAEVQASGYKVSGFWKYASGSLHATAFTANCHLKENGKQLFNPDGSPVVGSFVFRKEEVTVHRTWSAMGMIATGTHSFEITGVQVPFNRRFEIDPGRAVPGDPIFRYPFLQLAETTLAVNISGMALRFAELANETINSKFATNVAEAKARLHACRVLFYSEVEQSWNVLVSQHRISDDLLSRVSDASRALVKIARGLVNELYPLCGLSAASYPAEINRVWRNFHTAAQHSLLNM